MPIPTFIPRVRAMLYRMVIQSITDSCITTMNRRITARTFLQIYSRFPGRKSFHTTIARRFINGDGRSLHRLTSSINQEVEVLYTLSGIPEEIDESTSMILENFTPLSQDEIKNLLRETMLIATEDDPRRIRNTCKKLREISRHASVYSIKHLMKLEPLWKRDEVQGSK